MSRCSWRVSDSELICLDDDVRVCLVSMATKGTSMPRIRVQQPSKFTISKKINGEPCHVQIFPFSNGLGLVSRATSPSWSVANIPMVNERDSSDHRRSFVLGLNHRLSENSYMVDLESGHVTICAPPLTVRFNPTVFHQNQRLILFGGEDDRYRLAPCIEMYDLATNQWTEIATIPVSIAEQESGESSMWKWL